MEDTTALLARLPHNHSFQKQDFLPLYILLINDPDYRNRARIMLMTKYRTSAIHLFSLVLGEAAII